MRGLSLVLLIGIIANADGGALGAEPHPTASPHLTRYEIFRFDLGWAALPEGVPISASPSSVTDVTGLGGGFFQLQGPVTFTKEKYDAYIDTMGGESPCDLAPEPCYRIRVDARFTVRQLFDGPNVISVSRWCLIQGAETYIMNSLYGHPECANDYSLRLDPATGWQWTSWSRSGEGAYVFRANGVTYGRIQSQMMPQRWLELMIGARFECASVAVDEWLLAESVAIPDAPPGDDGGVSRVDIRAELDRIAARIRAYENEVDAARREVLAERYPELAEDLELAQELVSALRDLIDATSPEASDERKAELLRKYGWTLIEKVLTGLGAPKIVIEAIEFGYALGTPIGEHVAAGCESLTVIDLRNQAYTSFLERFPPDRTGVEWEYGGRRYRRLADGHR